MALRMERAEFEELARWWARREEIRDELVQRIEEAATARVLDREDVFPNYDAMAAWQAEQDAREEACNRAKSALLEYEKETLPHAEKRLKAVLPTGSWVLVGEDLAISKIVDGWGHDWLQACDPRTPRDTWPPLEYVWMP